MTTVIIPVFNRERLVARCLDSIRAQSVPPQKVIVVDNASTDGSLAAVRDWIHSHKTPGFEISLLSEPKPGASAARNRGLREVTTPYVIFFDSDDVMHPDLVKTALEATGLPTCWFQGVDSLESLAHIRIPDLVIWKAQVVTLGGKTHQKPFHTDNLIRRQFYNSILSTQCFMARTELMRQVGGWNEQALVWNDWELGLRLALACNHGNIDNHDNHDKIPRPPHGNPDNNSQPLHGNPDNNSQPLHGANGGKIVYVNRVLATIYAQEESITGRSFSDKPGAWENTLDIVERHIQSQPEGPQQRRLLQMLAYRRANLAALYAREGAERLARPLLAKALAPLSNPRRLLLRLLYRYTRRGGRAAYYLWR